ncbi:MAG: hypothetical protein HYY01_14365 [Chloroflexi bacterium]|nr:hypothetical protein [Chloroflexota bacterium]
MADLEAKPTGSFEQVIGPQMEIYAKELRQHFLEERRLRSELEKEYCTLQQRIKEIEALNRLFQQHLQNYFTAVQAHAEVATKLEQITQEVQALTKLLQRTALASEGFTPTKPMG